MKDKIKTSGTYFLLILLVVVVDLPIINMLGVSLKSAAEIMTNNSLFSKRYGSTGNQRI